MKILVVENFLPVSERLLSLLAQSGRYVGIACAVSSMLPELIELHQPAALLMDVRLDGGNGFELLMGLRSRGFTRPVVMLSASNDAQYPLHAEAMGANAFLSKTSQFDKIIPTLNRLLMIEIPTKP
jgi:DNA-binding NarL/FixJ family response regulator